MSTEEEKEGDHSPEERSWLSEALDLRESNPDHRLVFVIMPFTAANERGKEDLDQLFENGLKTPIESCKNLGITFVVQRSCNKLRINNEMMRDIATADYVIADLSGSHSNPNVMYELGVRFAISREPVILIRENHPNNKPIFDVEHLHTYLYHPDRLDDLGHYVVEKLKAFEQEEERYVSPVLESVEEDYPLLQKVSRERALSGLEFLAGILSEYLEVYGNIATKALDTVGLDVETYNNVVNGDVSDQNMLPSLTEQIVVAERLVASLTGRPVDHAVGAYLASPFMVSLLPNRVVEQFHQVIRSYYIRFFVQDSHWLSGRPILAVNAFVRATFLVNNMVKDIRDLLLMGFEGPINLDEHRKGWIAADHIQFVMDMQEYLNDLNESRESLLQYIAYSLKQRKD